MLIPSTKVPTSTQHKIFWGVVKPAQMCRLFLVIDSVQHIALQNRSRFATLNTFSGIKEGFI